MIYCNRFFWGGNALRSFVFCIYMENLCRYFFAIATLKKKGFLKILLSIFQCISQHHIHTLLCLSSLCQVCMYILQSTYSICFSNCHLLSKSLSFISMGIGYKYLCTFYLEDTRYFQSMQVMNHVFKGFQNIY